MATRVTSNLSVNTKKELKALQVHLKLKNESQAVAYLISLYTIRFPKILLAEHELCLEKMNDLENQQSF
jgi:hypothetical protein